MSLLSWWRRLFSSRQDPVKLLPAGDGATAGAIKPSEVLSPVVTSPQTPGVSRSKTVTPASGGATADGRLTEVRVAVEVRQADSIEPGNSQAKIQEAKTQEAKTQSGGSPIAPSANRGTTGVPPLQASSRDLQAQRAEFDAEQQAEEGEIERVIEGSSETIRLPGVSPQEGGSSSGREGQKEERDNAAADPSAPQNPPGGRLPDPGDSASLPATTPKPSGRTLPRDPAIRSRVLYFTPAIYAPPSACSAFFRQT